MAVGQQVDLNFLDEKYQIQLNSRGLIDVAEETQMTSRKGVFAGGDVTTGPSTVIQCVANGHTAARGINNYLGLPAEHASGSMQKDKTFRSIDQDGIQVKKGLKLLEVPLNERSIDKEDEIAPDKKAAFTEAKRCMDCGCYSVAPSDIAPVLVALDATIVTTDREIPAQTFCENLKVGDILAKGELVTEVVIPIPKGAVTAYDKFRLREAIDWAIISLASAFAQDGGKKITGARLVLGGVAPVPIRLNEVEGYLLGKAVDDKTISGACELAVKECFPMWKNKYKVQEIKAYIEKALRRLA
jgi:CO/xanthine dehydrogenase FAD-binding subunit